MKIACGGAALLVLGLTLSPEVAAGERICGTQYLRLHADEFRLPSFKVHHFKQQEDEIKVGSQREFHVPLRFALLPATCRFVGAYSYVFVEDAQWDGNGGPVLQLDADFLGDLFEVASPADPTRGLFELETATFGAPPDVDDDPKIYILILQLDRGLLGFFDPGNATNPNPELRRDMIFINSAVLLTNQYAAGGTLAHEFQHLIHSGHDGDEETWLDEGLSGYAELLSGHPEIDSTNVPEFLRRPGIGVTGWQDQSYNYGATYLYVAFLAERFGVGVMGDLVSEPRNGIDGVDATLAPFQENFRTTWAGWTAANYAATDVRFGYDAIGERRAAPLVVPPPRLPFERKGAAVDEQWGTTYVLFREAGSTEIEFFGDPNGRYAVQIYVMRNGSGDLRNMELDRDSHGFTRVANADSFVVIVGRTSVRGEEFELSARNFDPVTAVVAAAAADEAGLELPFPNPFNSHVVLPFHLQTEGADAVLRLYGVLGNPIRTLRLGILPRGTHQLTWDGTDDQGRQVASGRYLAKLQAGSISSLRSLTLVR